jgi:hypothetical protein
MNPNRPGTHWFLPLILLIDEHFIAPAARYEFEQRTAESPDPEEAELNYQGPAI